MNCPTTRDHQQGASTPTQHARAIRAHARALALGVVILGLGVAHAADEGAFYAHFKRWTKNLAAPAAASMDSFVHFPLMVDGQPITRDELARDSATRRALFSKQSRERLSAIPASEVQSFADRTELSNAAGVCATLPSDGSIFEVDVEADHGGPARRFVFGGEAVGLRLYCVTRP